MLLKTILKKINEKRQKKLEDHIYERYNALFMTNYNPQMFALFIGRSIEDPSQYQENNGKGDERLDIVIKDLFGKRIPFIDEVISLYKEWDSQYQYLSTLFKNQTIFTKFDSFNKLEKIEQAINVTFSKPYEELFKDYPIYPNEPFEPYKLLSFKSYERVVHSDKMKSLNLFLHLLIEVYRNFLY